MSNIIVPGRPGRPIVVDPGDPPAQVRVDAGGRIPPGGTAGQSLTKVSDQDYATAWATATASASWDDITGKPATFPPSAHTHPASEITDFAAAVAATPSVAANTAKVTNATHTGEVTGDGALTIAAGAVTLSKMANLAASTIIGNNTGAPATPIALTAAQVRVLLNVADGATANASDASLRDRATHTGTQLAATISDFSTAVAATAAVTANTAKVSNATHTGDVTGDTALTLATVNSNVGSFGSATQVATFTVNGKGLTTAAGNTTIAIPSSAVTDFNSASRAQTEAALIAGANVTITPAGSGATRTLTIAAAGGGATNLTYTAATRVIASDTGTDATLPLFTSGDAGLAPASGGGTTNFLRADGTWAAPAGGGAYDYGRTIAMNQSAFVM